MADWTTARVTPETLAELRRAALIEGHDAAHYPTGVVLPTRTLLALLDAAAERDRLAGAVERVRALATEWATQPNDYGEDTEQQIEDGGAILRALDATPETGGES